MSKNLPDAINWHYAGTWSHIFKGYKKNLEEVWSQSTNLLRRAIALPIMVNMTDERINEIVEKVKVAIKEVL